MIVMTVIMICMCACTHTRTRRIRRRKRKKKKRKSYCYSRSQWAVLPNSLMIISMKSVDYSKQIVLSLGTQYRWLIQPYLKRSSNSPLIQLCLTLALTSRSSCLQISSLLSESDEPRLCSCRSLIVFWNQQVTWER